MSLINILSVTRRRQYSRQAADWWNVKQVEWTLLQQIEASNFISWNSSFQIQADWLIII